MHRTDPHEVEARVEEEDFQVPRRKWPVTEYDHFVVASPLTVLALDLVRLLSLCLSLSFCGICRQKDKQSHLCAGKWSSKTDAFEADYTFSNSICDSDVLC